jgi:outer membrane protein TolC
MPLRSTRLAIHCIPLSAILCAAGFIGNNPAYAQAYNQSLVPIPLSLSQAITLALKQNRTLQLAHLAVIESEQKKEIAHSAYLPHIQNESSLLHVTELAGIEIPTGAFGTPPSTGAIPAKNLFIGQGSATTYTSGTGLSQPLTQMFKIRESNRAATADINTAKIQLDGAEDEVALKVRQMYYGLLMGQLTLQAAKAEVNAAQIKVQEAGNAVAQGRALDIAALESRAALLDAQQSVLTQTLQIRDLTLSLNDLLGLPLSSQLQLDDDTTPASLVIPSREECLRVAQERNPEVRAARQGIDKARAGLAAARDAYIPNVTGLARYSYQSGVPLLVHNFGTFGFNLNYELFDGGRRNSEIKDARTLLSEAELNLAKASDELTVQVETAYDKVDQMRGMVAVAEQAHAVRTEAARLADRQFEQRAMLASAREEAHAKAASAKAALLEATLGLSIAQAELQRTVGLIPQ